jgi:DNA-directed RNA polymerase specialized sigma24 family protein
MKDAYNVITKPAQTGEDATDGFIIARSCAEPEQFALLFRRHASDLGRYAARRLGPGPAEDIVAETFLAAFRHRDRYDVTRSDARPWLYGIAGNLIRRHYRDEVDLRPGGRGAGRSGGNGQVPDEPGQDPAARRPRRHRSHQHSR